MSSLRSTVLPAPNFSTVVRYCLGWSLLLLSLTPSIIHAKEVSKDLNLLERQLAEAQSHIDQLEDLRIPKGQKFKHLDRAKPRTMVRNR